LGVIIDSKKMDPQRPVSKQNKKLWTSGNINMLKVTSHHLNDYIDWNENISYSFPFILLFGTSNSSSLVISWCISKLQGGPATTGT
jgi:hypothetical protein